MSFLARWSVVLALCLAVAAAAVQPVWEHGTRQAASAAASTDEATTSSGFTPAPEKPTYIGPGLAFPGATVISAFVPSQSLVASRLQSRATAAFSPALHAPRLSPHLHSIPLLI